MNKLSTRPIALIIAAALTLTIAISLRCCADSTVPIPQAGNSGLTFFAWSDLHIKRDGQCAHLDPIIDAINTLPGTPAPAPLGATVPSPAFIFGCGDNTDWPTSAAVNALTKQVIPRLKFPAFSILGNHDEGDDPDKNLVRTWIENRHGSASYSFDSGGIHFIALFSRFNAKQAITPQALNFIRQDLAKIPKSRPVIIATHLCFEAISNKDEFINSFADANVILIMGGHLHHATVTRYRNRNFIQVPSPTVLNQFWIIRITPDRLVALVYDYKAKKWLDKPALDTPISGPGSAAPSSRPAATRAGARDIFNAVLAMPPVAYGVACTGKERGSGLLPVDLAHFPVALARCAFGKNPKFFSPVFQGNPRTPLRCAARFSPFCATPPVYMDGPFSSPSPRRRARTAFLIRIPALPARMQAHPARLLYLLSS